MSQFHISDENPNVVVGGAGCACHPRGGDETRGPFIIFTPSTTDDNLSPHVVICEHCAIEAVGACEAPEESVIDVEAIEDPGDEWPHDPLPEANKPIIRI